MHSAPKWPYFVVTVGLVLYLWGFIGQTRLATLPADAVPPDLRFPVAIEGMTAGSQEELHRLAEGFAADAVVSLELPGGGGMSIPLRHRYGPVELAIILLSGLLFWAVSAFIFAPRVAQGSVHDFFWGMVLFGLAIMIGGVYFPRDPVWAGTAANLLQIGALAVLPVLFMHLSLSFPRRDAVLDRFPWMVPVLWAVALGLIVWQGWAFHRYFARPGPDTVSMLRVSHAAAQGTLVVQVACAIVILFLRNWRLEYTGERNQLKWILWGFFVGVTPYVFLRTLPELLGIEPPLGSGFDRAFEVAIPSIVLFTVIRYRFLDIDIIIRRSLIYGILTGFFLALYLGGGLVLGYRIDEPTWASLFLVLGLAAGVMFFPVRDALGAWVDRTFFKVRHDYDVALARTEARLDAATGPAEVAAILASLIDGTVSPERFGVLVREDVRARGIPGEDARRLMDAARLRDLSRTLAAANSTSLPDLESEAFPADLAQLGVVLVEPVRRGNRTAGLVLLGRKRSGWRYIEPDLRAVRAACDAAGGVLERLELVRAVAREADERRRLSELDRLKNEFLSQVAHDLRTPLTSISWSTENLLDGLPGELNPAQAEYLLSIKTSVIYLNRLVENLLRISRLEKGAAGLELEPVDLASLVDQASSTLVPMARERNIGLEIREAEEPTSVLGDPGKIYEVAINLMDNAIRYSADDSVVEITVGRVDNGRPGFTVRDHGPGFGSQDPEALFDRFRQGAPSPHGGRRGFGLGLYIVRSYMDLMGGEVSASSHPGGGALFTCVFPEPAKPPAEEAR